MRLGFDRSRTGLSASSSSTTYAPVVPSENDTINPSSPSGSVVSIRIGLAAIKDFLISLSRKICLILLGRLYGFANNLFVVFPSVVYWFRDSSSLRWEAASSHGSQAHWGKAGRFTVISFSPRYPKIRLAFYGSVPGRGSNLNLTIHKTKSHRVFCTPA
jgi:hypothetical protein